MKLTEFTLFSQKSKPRYLPVKNQKSKKIILIPYSTLNKLFNDTILNKCGFHKAIKSLKKKNWIK